MKNKKVPHRQNSFTLLIDGFKMDIIDLQYTAFQTNITEFTDDGM
jgi:hypothetical protein